VLYSNTLGKGLVPRCIPRRGESPKGALIRRLATCAAKAPPRHSGRGYAAPAPRITCGAGPRRPSGRLMAIYRLSADLVRRSAGRTVTAAAAYRAGALIVDERTGLAFDYRRRRGVLDAAILAPAAAPAWILDRARLWNAAELTEKRKDAQLARDIELALPHELTPAARRELVHGFVRAAFVDAGMVADIAIHAPGGAGDTRNFHAHVLLTLRAIAGDGFGPKVRAWNEAAQLDRWRTLWAEHVNRALEQAGASARVDHRSLAAQGIARLPQIHLGPAVCEMQRRGLAPGRAELAQEIAAANAALAPLAAAEATGAREAVRVELVPQRSFRAPTAPLRAPAAEFSPAAQATGRRARPARLMLFRRVAGDLARRLWRIARLPHRAPAIARMIEARAPS